MSLPIDVKSNSVAFVGWHDGGAGQIHAWLEKESDYHVSCFINPTGQPLNIDPSKIQRDATQFSYPTEDSFKDRPLLNDADWARTLVSLGITKVLVTTDDPYERYVHIKQARTEGLTLINAIHSTACIMEEAILHDNVILFPQSYVGYRAEVHSGAIVNGGHLDHHNVMRECSMIDPGAVCAGNVTIGSFSRVHTGVSIKNRIRIGENSIIGAGAVVVADVCDNVTVVGVPGAVIKQREPLSVEIGV